MFIHKESGDKVHLVEHHSDGTVTARHIESGEERRGPGYAFFQDHREATAEEMTVQPLDETKVTKDPAKEGEKKPADIPGK